MARDRDGRMRPLLESLERRLQLSSAWPINTIGTSEGAVAQPGAVTSASVTVNSRNLTVDKPTTMFGIFVQQDPGSKLVPRIVAVEESNGQKLPIQPGAR